MARSAFLSIGAGALLGLASAAFAEVAPQDREAVVRLVQSRGGSAADVAPLLDEVDRAAARGLPQATLVNKLKEGLSKGVPPPRVHAVLRDLAGRMDSSRELLGAVDPAVGARSIEVMAEALGRGATRADVEEIARLAHGEGPRPAAEAMAFGAKSWALMKEAGIPARDGLPLVAEAVRQGFRGADLLALASEVARRRDDFASGRVSLDAVRDSVRRGERPERLFPPREAAPRRERPVRVERPETERERDRPERPPR